MGLDGYMKVDGRGSIFHRISCMDLRSLRGGSTKATQCGGGYYHQPHPVVGPLALQVFMCKDNHVKENHDMIFLSL